MSEQLKPFLSGIANAIRTKEASGAEIPALDFKQRILDLPTTTTTTKLKAFYLQLPVTSIARNFGIQYVHPSNGWVYFFSSIGLTILRFNFLTFTAENSGGIAAPHTMPAGSYQTGAFDGEGNLYFGATGTTTSIGEFTIANNYGYRRTVPSGYWESPVKGSDGLLYFTGGGKRTYICRFNGLENKRLGEKITVPEGSWGQQISGKDGNMYYTSQDYRILILNEDTKASVVVDVPTDYGYWTLPFLGNDGAIYYTGNSAFLRFDMLSRTYTIINLPVNTSGKACLGSDGNFYFKVANTSNFLLKFDILLQTATTIEVPSISFSMLVLGMNGCLYSDNNVGGSNVLEFDIKSQTGRSMPIRYSSPKLVNDRGSYSPVVDLNGVIIYGDTTKETPTGTAIPMIVFRSVL